MPIALTDAQLAVIMAAAEPLAPADRSAFLETVAGLLHSRRWRRPKERGAHMSANPKPKFAVGDRVIDRETGVEGVVVYCYEDPRLVGEIIAVKFDYDAVPVAVPLDSIKLAPGK